MPICKTASSSLIAYFIKQMYGKDCVYSGDTRRKLGKEFRMIPCEGNVRLGKYFTFAFVRNPWNRAVSAHKTLMKWRARYEALGDEAWSHYNFWGLSAEKMILELMNDDLSFENFVHFIKNVERNHHEVINQHWRSQAGILQIETYPRGLIEYDFIGKLESVEVDFSYVTNKLNLEPETLPGLNASEKYNYKEYYKNTKLIDDVGEYYTRDIEVFGYEYGK